MGFIKKAYSISEEDEKYIKTYKIEENVDSKTKIGVISDLRFGSKNEQISKPY